MNAITDRVNWLSANSVCTRRDFAGEIVGDPCPGCGHSNVLHIGTDACVTCEMHAYVAELRRTQKENRQ